MIRKVLNLLFGWASKDATPRPFVVPIEVEDEPIILPFVMRRRSPDLHAEGYPRLYDPEGADECGEGLSDGAGI